MILTIEAANDEFVVNTINQAEAIWIAGGDQSNYTNYWKGTPVQEALNDRILQGIPIGGTSAGLNVLTSLFILHFLARA
ncbi:Type 1 glutamine amidotransferase-like domain-containing protein [Nitrosomonas communis]|uniref:Type 1 glutamine amidotransferase-like domain-containing protein n=1 Tax=Nitrosomonas communis TaxID=44574 RepID=UPI0009F5261F